MSESESRENGAGIPPRGPAVPEGRMLVPFDVDCGELVQGHRFIARGIQSQGTINEPDGLGEFPAISLEYELVPGIPSSKDDGPFACLVGVEYDADVPLPWEPVDGGAIAPFEGGASTHGSLGDWPLPTAARVLRFVLTAAERSRRERDDAGGVLVVDLQDGSARWSDSMR